MLAEVAWAATRSKDTFYSARYHRLAARRGRKRALIAVAHSMLKSVYHVLKESTAYRELGASYLHARQESRRIAHHVRELKKLGVEVPLPA